MQQFSRQHKDKYKYAAQSNAWSTTSMIYMKHVQYRNWHWSVTICLKQGLNFSVDSSRAVSDLHSFYILYLHGDSVVDVKDYCNPAKKLIH